MLVNNIDFCWEKRAVLHSGEMLKSRILGEEGTLLPGRLGEDVGEIALSQLCSAQTLSFMIT